MDSIIKENREKEALKNIKILAKKIDRSPRIKDWEKHNMSPTYSTILNTFGSWKKAVSMATGKVYSQGKWTRETIISVLKELDIKLGRAPSRSEFQEMTDMEKAPQWRTVLRMFGSWDNALDAAECRKIIRVRYTRSEMISQIHWMRIELGHIPKCEELAEFDGVASSESFRKEFGSWAEALDQAGLNMYSKESLLEQMQLMVQILGRVPSCKDCDKFCSEGVTACSRKFEKVFGTWNEAVKAAGYEPNRQFGDLIFSKEKLIELIKEMHKELGRTPTVSDCKDRYQQNVFPSMTVFLYRFGSWNEAVKAAGLVPNKPLPWLATLRK
jgi:hypothetical protein